MEKEENQNNLNINNDQDTKKEDVKPEENLNAEVKQETDQQPEEQAKELSPEEKITELEDKVARTFAEMENQRRRFEKEKEDAFEYGGYSFAKEALNLIDNLDRSKQVLESDDKLKETTKPEKNIAEENKQGAKQEPKEEIKEPTPEEKIAELEDKVARTFAEMENQRRRFEKEKEDAFEYGGYAFAKESLNLIDNLERSKSVLENDESLKNTNVLKKAMEHFDIIYKDLISIFNKNDIKPI